MISAIRLWVFLSAGLVATGWILSALHALNRAGYAASFLLLATLLAGCFCAGRPRPPAISRAWHTMKRRFRRPAPLLFLAIFYVNLFGGIIASPEDWDTRAYRFPRILHWLGQAGWHWIHTGDSRMNIAGCTFEWLVAPILLFLRTERWVFLLNALPYLLLPGLLFAILRRLKVARHTAWWWMWILPAASCYALQGCSNDNDTMGAVFALAAIMFSLRADQTGKVSDLLFSFLAAGLMTGTKQTNLPLLLPYCLAALRPTIRLLARRPILTTAATVAGLLVSVLPTMLLNEHYVGTWTGFPSASSREILAWGEGQELASPLWGLIGNLFCFPAQNLLPPFFPWAGAWNQAMGHFLTTGLGSHFQQFESFGLLDRSTRAGNAGIGFAVTGLAVVSIWAARRRRGPPVLALHVPWVLRLLRWTPWIALLVFLAKVGTYENARQAAPYYPLLLPLLLAVPGHAVLVRQRWWRGAALGVMTLSVGLLSLDHGRSILPPSWVAGLQAKYPHSKFLSVFGDFYLSHQSVQIQRRFIDVGPAATESVIGYATTVGGAEPGWWLPFERRQVVRVIPGDGLADLSLRHVHYLAVEEIALQGKPIEQWAQQFKGKVVDSASFMRTPGSPWGTLYLIQLPE